MNKKQIAEIKVLMKESYYEEKYLKTYNLTMQLLENAKKNPKCFTSTDYYFCYVYASNCSRRLGNNKLATEYAEQSLTYATKESELIISYNALAICYQVDNKIELAKSTYDKCIELYNSWIKKFDSESITEKNKLLLSRADVLHNKADMLKDVDLILESIELYNSLLYKEGIDTKDILKRVNKAYKNIDEINNTKVHTMATTPIWVIK